MMRRQWRKRPYRKCPTGISSGTRPIPIPTEKKITGVVCGIRVEEIQEPLMQEIRYLDKLVDELAKGKAMEKILRQ